MQTTVEKFIAEFKSIQGDYLGQRKKSFFILLNSNQSLKHQKEILDEIVKNLVPESYLEEVFKIELLLFFRRIDDLLEVLKNGNDIFRSRIIKQPWFLPGVIARYTAESFVKNFLTTVSYSVRVKILRNVSKFSDSDFVDKIFEMICDKYGMQTALILVMGCSRDKIQSILVDTEAKLSGGQIKVLCKKHPSLIVDYIKFGEVFNRRGNRPYKITQSIALNDPDLLFELVDKHNWNIGWRRLGRRTTKKLVEAKRDEFIKNPNKYEPLVKQSRLVRYVGKDFPTMFKNALPSDTSVIFSSQAYYLLIRLPKHRQYDLYFDTFQEVYGKNLWDEPNCMSQYLLHRIPRLKDKEKWAEQFDKPRKYIKYYRMENSYQTLLNDFNNCSSISSRMKKLGELLDVCKLNQDYNLMLQLSKLVSTRLKNSDSGLLQVFLSKLHDFVKYEKLSVEHWKYLYDILSLQRMKKKQIFHPLFFAYIEHTFNIGKPIKDLVVQYMQVADLLKIGPFESDEFNKELVTCYLGSLESLENLSKANCVRIIHGIKNVNETHREEVFSIEDYPVLINALMDTVRPKRRVYKKDFDKQALEYVLCSQKSEPRQDIERIEGLYFTYACFKAMQSVSINKWYARHKPEVWIENVHRISEIRENRYMILNHIRKLSNFGVPQRMIRICQEANKNANMTNSKLYVDILSVLMPDEDFLKLSETYKLVADKLAVESSTDEYEDNKNEAAMRLACNIGCEIAKCLKNVSFRDRAISEAIFYATGDYLKFALTSIYSLFSRLPEDRIREYLSRFNSKKVSVKKHKLYLTCAFLPRREVYEKFHLDISDSEGKSKRNLLIRSLKYFWEEPTDEMWDILKSCLIYVDGKSNSTLEMLSKVSKVSKKYRREFVEIVWVIYAKYSKFYSNVKGNEVRLIKELKQEDFRVLNWNFCGDIIRNKLFKECDIDSNYLNFTVKCLFYGGDDFEPKLQFVFRVLETYKNTYWSSNNYETKNNCNRFCSEIYSTFMSANDKERSGFPKNFAKSFYERWEKLLSEVESFESHLQCNFMALKSESNYDVKFLAREIKRWFARLYESYDFFIYDKFRDFCSINLKKLLVESNVHWKQSNIHLIRLFYEILEGNDSEAISILVVELLPKEVFGGAKDKLLLNAILEKLERKENSVRVYFWSEKK